ncbi:dihydrofolate reductase family protein [Actinoplanes sp. KI2]|uniref:dihydrofolate reductase family protein n=1 Tax=Actinoplanes sp. KI2 TaxID=2983315 RepID=UPI0021D56B0C|nr:dihydrofolate reductase family protein [Actinoplanes sp. KI2]MCU7725428.1 dihydrofolate reductase family protein [Actinoplanes sp. KI2]
MARIVVSENVTLDGVVTDPTGEEGTGHGGWFTRTIGRDREAWAEIEYDEALRSDAVLIGRRSYEYFAPRWADRTGDWADRFNSMPKYVLTATAGELTWNNSTAVSGEVPTVVAKLKEEVEGDIVVYASSRLVPELVRHDLVDELRLMVFPVVAGWGAGLFASLGAIRPLRLVSHRTVGENLLHLAYRPA